MIRVVALTSALTIAALSVAIAAVKEFAPAPAPAPCATSCMTSMGSMSDSGMGSDMTMGAHAAHMTLTALRPPAPGDQQRADAIVAALRVALAKYSDYRVAEADGFKPFLPNFPQPRYHFTNMTNALAALSRFDPSRPTSLLYAKDGSGYKLVGAMYTAPRNSTPNQLDARVPLSIARWHEHTNICWAPLGTDKSAYIGPDAKFGLAGSIATQSACDAAGGRFTPVILNWMVHVYPFETEQAQIWHVDM